MFKRGHTQSQELVEQRQREDAAPRLRDETSRLISLRFNFHDIRAEGQVVASSYARPIVVETAPAHFEIRCLEPECTGRHDLTFTILAHLRRAEESFSGDSACDGMVGNTPCSRTLGYTCTATYRP